MFLDGGIRFLRLDPISGALLSEEIMDSIDPVSGQEIHEAYVKKMTGNNMPVALSDVLTSNGKSIWMRSQKFGLDGKRQEIGLDPVTEQSAEDAHLFCQVGLLDDSYFFRSFWSFGRRVSGGYGSWMQAGRLIPSGRILCYDNDLVYGFGRKPQYMTNASVLEYEFFAAQKTNPRQSQIDINKKGRKNQPPADRQASNPSDWKMRSTFPRKDLSVNQYQWTLDQPALIGRAITLAGDTLFFAGPPNLVNERQAFYQPDDPDVMAALAHQEEAFKGEHGGQLWGLSKKNGQVLARYALNSAPVFDGMIAANGRLFIASIDGTMVCLSAAGSIELTSQEDQPLTTIWEGP